MQQKHTAQVQATFICYGQLPTITINIHRTHHWAKYPLSAMVAIWHHIVVSFNFFGTERVHSNFDILGEMQQSEVHCGKECLVIGGSRLNGLRGTSSPFC